MNQALDALIEQTGQSPKVILGGWWRAGTDDQGVGRAGARRRAGSPSQNGERPRRRAEGEAAALLANCRKGYGAKTVLSDSGAMQIEVPRDPAGSFEPLLAPKWQKKLPGFEEKIIALYARSMTVRDIKAMLEAQYHIEVSAEFPQWIDETIRGKN